MPRNRTIADDVILDAALDIVHRGGPAALSFGAVADQVGLAGSTIVQRFRSKPELLQAALLLAWRRLEHATEQAIAAAPPGPEGVVDLLVTLSGEYEANDFADQLLVLREDLRDPVLRRRGEAWIGRLAESVERRIGDLPGGANGLGLLVVTHWQGTLTVWSFTRPDSLRSTVRASLTRLLDRLAAGPTQGV